ncbi:response regulator [Microbacterium hibisci]|uniref:response regulator n=1 Tax=Microbacterium hibisci TaxID=2036000 RepID=UPI001944D716|nr:response regulator [Microbacterium hibisci]
MTAPIRVLVVDDDFRVAGLHRDVVAARAGYTALDPVHSLGAARQAVRAHAPDLLLVDAFLPDGDGVEFVAAAGVDAFVLSAATDAATVRRALRAGALAYLTKPFEARVLADRLDRYARLRNLLTGERPLEQEQIDRALSIMHGGAEPATVARSATEQLILEGLGDDEASAAEIADRVGISRATAQRHLAGLAGRGQVEVRLRYGTTGRPEHRYVAVRR